MRLPGFQAQAIDENGNPGIPIEGCPNCGKIHEDFRGERFLTVPCSRACRLQWEYAEQVHQQPEARS